MSTDPVPTSSFAPRGSWSGFPDDADIQPDRGGPYPPGAGPYAPDLRESDPRDMRGAAPAGSPGGMPPPQPSGAHEPRASAARIILPLLIGSMVAVSLGVYGKLHEPTGIAVSVVGFSGPQTVKVWLGTVAASFGVLQLLTALMMWGKLPGPAWIGGLHRWSGRIAFLFTIPVAVHCLYALGFATFDNRTLAHSLLGCAFFGAFTTKMIILPRRGVPGWALPLFGGLLFAVLIGVWLTSSLWFFTTSGFKL